MAPPPERLPDPAGEALWHVPHQPAQSAVLQLHQSHVVLQLLGRHVDVPSVPQHPPDQAEEDDNGPSVDEQVVDKEPSKHPHHDDDDAQYVMGQGEPEKAHAAADPWVASLRGRFHPYRRWPGGRGHGPNQYRERSREGSRCFVWIQMLESATGGDWQKHTTQPAVAKVQGAAAVISRVIKRFKSSLIDLRKMYYDKTESPT